MVQELGDAVVERLSRSQQSVTLHYHDEKVAIAEQGDVVILTELPLEDALRVLAVLGKSDEEMSQFITRYELIDRARRSL